MVPKPIYVHTPTTDSSLPSRGKEYRFAVGTPDGPSSNSWKLTSRRTGDIYLACRDNFKEIKISLHASGRWRIGFTTEALSRRPDILTPSSDRVWDKWTPEKDSTKELVVAYQLLILPDELHVTPDSRIGWKKVHYLEPEQGKAAVFSVCITPSKDPLNFELQGAVLHIADLDSLRTVQLVAHLEPEASIRALLHGALPRVNEIFDAKGLTMPANAILALSGYRLDGIRWFSAMRYSED